MICRLLALTGMLVGQALFQVVMAQECQFVESLVRTAEQQKTSDTAPPPPPAGRIAPKPPVPPIPQQGQAASKLQGISLAQLKTIQDVHKTLSTVGRIRPRLLICDTTEINAEAASIGGMGVVAFHVPLLELLKYDRDAVAFVMSHEFAHLLLGHTSQVNANRRSEALDALRAGAEYERSSGQRGVGILVARQVFEGAQAAYSRVLEKNADDTGYQLMRMANFDTSGALKAAKILLVTMGNDPTGFFDRHPGWEERVAGLEGLVADEAKRKERIVNAEQRRGEDNTYARVVDELLREKRWREASQYVAAWIGSAPESGPGWYYQGILLRGSRVDRVKAIDAFEKAIEFDPENPDAMKKLCELLYDLRHRRESAHCGRDLAVADRVKFDELRDRLWQDRLFVGGGSFPAPKRLWMSKEQNGSTYITNDASLRRPSHRVSDSIPEGRTPLPWHR